MEKLENESDAAHKIRCRLVNEYGCTFQPNHRIFFFEHPYIEPQHSDMIRTVRFLDALYCALQASEKVVALRAYVQLCEYSCEAKYSHLRYNYETAFHEAKRRIEKFLET